MKTEQTEQQKYLKTQLKQFEADFTMTLQERKALRKWVSDGNDIYANPSSCADDNGSPMNYVEALRFEELIRKDRILRSN